MNDSNVVDFIKGGKEEKNIKEKENKNRINEEKDILVLEIEFLI